MKKTYGLFGLSLLPASIWAATISGTITTNGGSTQLSGAKVVLIASSVRVDSTVTDSVGHYAFDSAQVGATGTKTIEASHAGAYNTTTANTNINNANTNATVNIDLGFRGSISGTIRRASDSAVIGNALVVLRRSSATGTFIDSVRSDSLGAFTFANISSGTPNYWVIATATGYATGTFANISLPSGGAVSFTLYLPFPGSISGTIRSAADSVTPINGVLVQLRRGSATGTVVDSVPSASGSYSFTNLVPGAPNYWVTASVTGYVSTTNANVVVTSGGATTSNLYLAPIVAATISGTVTGSPGGAGIANALVVLRRSSATSTILDSVRTNGAGSYSFSGVAPLTPNYWITASANGFISATNNNVAVPNGGAVTSNFSLTALATITGLLINDPVPEIATAIRGALVTLQHGSDVAPILDSVRSDSLGRYTFRNLVSDTLNYWVTAYTNVGTATHGDLLVTSGGTTVSDFDFVPAGVNSMVFKSSGIRFVRSGDRLILNLGVSSVARTVEVYGMNGSLHTRISVKAGETQAVVPATFANGFMFRVK